MSGSKGPQPVLKNRILAALPVREQDRLLPHLETVFLPREQILHEPDQSIRYVYFPTDGVLSWLAILEDGSAVEASTIGNEGLLGVPLALGSHQPLGRGISQIPGYSMRIKATAFKKEIQRGGALLELVHAYTCVLLMQTAQGTACNSRHSIKQRFIRWLLMTQDRLRTDTFQLTQELMGIMIGVRRGSISEVAVRLQKAGLIRYHYGQMTIVDRRGLEAAVCECYGIIKKEFDRFLRQAFS